MELFYTLETTTYSVTGTDTNGCTNNNGMFSSRTNCYRMILQLTEVTLNASHLQNYMVSFNRLKLHQLPIAYNNHLHLEYCVIGSDSNIADTACVIITIDNDWQY
jgi:hypothetical protein